jgi:monoterpene epsilon-lactone hydrolase
VDTPKPSIQYHLFKPLMCLARCLQGIFPVQNSTVLVRFRDRANRLADFFIRPPRDIKIIAGAVAGAAGDWIVPHSAPQDPVILFIHGGGICFGWNNPMRRELALLSRFTGLRAFGVDYKIAPENIYPVAHDECFAVFQELTGQGHRIVLVGESSGGALALALMLRSRAADLTQPILCVLISPVVDFGFRDEKIWTQKDPFAHPGFSIGLHRHYTSDQDTLTPDLAPIYSDLKGIAPLIILAGESELMSPEANRLVKMAAEYHVPVEAIFWPRVWHSWHALAPQLPESNQALESLAAAICERLDLIPSPVGIMSR